MGFLDGAKPNANLGTSGPETVPSQKEALNGTKPNEASLLDDDFN